MASIRHHKASKRAKHAAHKAHVKGTHRGRKTSTRRRVTRRKK